jgi:hypothetical protein
VVWDPGPTGAEDGRLGKILANGNGEPEYVRVKMGLFGSNSVLLPVLAVAVDDERRTLALR